MVPEQVDSPLRLSCFEAFVELVPALPEVRKKRIITTIQSQLSINISHLNVLALLSRVGWETNPTYLLLFLRDYIHRHQNIEGIVYTASDVFLVNWLKKNFVVKNAGSTNN